MRCEAERGGWQRLKIDRHQSRSLRGIDMHQQRMPARGARECHDCRQVFDRPRLATDKRERCDLWPVGILRTRGHQQRSGRGAVDRIESRFVKAPPAATEGLHRAAATGMVAA